MGLSSSSLPQLASSRRAPTMRRHWRATRAEVDGWLFMVLLGWSGWSVAESGEHHADGDEHHCDGGFATNGHEDGCQAEQHAC